MGDEGIGLEGKEKLSEIISDKVRDIKRFKEGFHSSIKRNIENRTITSEEGVDLIIELQKHTK